MAGITISAPTGPLKTQADSGTGLLILTDEHQFGITTDGNPYLARTLDGVGAGEQANVAIDGDGGVYIVPTGGTE